MGAATAYGTYCLNSTMRPTSAGASMASTSRKSGTMQRKKERYDAGKKER